VLWEDVIYSSRPGRKTFNFCNAGMYLDCGYFKLGLGCQQHSNNRSSMMYGSDLGFICHIHKLRKRSGKEFQKYISSHCLLCSNQLFDFFLLDKSNMVNDGPEYDDFVCLNPVSSWCCKLYSSHSSSYSLQVLGQSSYFQTRVHNT
jgi:hypothetical protein